MSVVSRLYLNCYPVHIHAQHGVRVIGLSVGRSVCLSASSEQFE